MSILACITVVECDQCKAIRVLETDAEYKTFEQTWFRQGSVTLCTLCSVKLDERCSADQKAVDRAVSKMVKKYGAAEVVNAG